MPSTPEIGIFCVGRTVVDREEVQRWLDFIGVKEFTLPEDGAVSNPALLIALAAKRCYKSFDTSLNPNLTRIRKEYGEYLDNVLKSNHGSVLEHSVYNFAIENVSRVFCYHPDTEVLTHRGWVPVADVGAGATILTLDPKTRRARWSVNHKTHAFEYSGPLYYWKNREDESPRVTPDHTLWCCPLNLRSVRGLRAAEAMISHGRKLPFSEMLGRPFFVQNAIGDIENAIDSAEIVLGNHSYDAADLLEWLGWIATDGTLTKPETGRHCVRVNQSKPEGVARLASLGQKLFGERLRVTGDTYKAFDVSCQFLYDWVMKMIGRTKNERDLAPLFNFSSRLVRSFLHGVYGGDGCHGNCGHRDIACGGNVKLAGQYQVLVAIAGRAARVTVRTKEMGKVHILTNGQEIVNRQPAVTVNEHQRGEGACLVKAGYQRIEHYAGLVYCPQTDDGVVYVRSHGKPLWCGNTAEMNRHRAGWAISEGSLRFIRFGENIPYWLPTSLRDNPADDDDLRQRKAASRDVFHEAFLQDETSYRKLEQIWDMDQSNHNFAYKKAVTSMMRRIIGLGVSTGGVWSGNIRALRHVITMRCEPAAEEEILHVFSRVASMIKEREPMLLGDFYQDETGFWRPKYRKV